MFLYFVGVNHQKLSVSTNCEYLMNPISLTGVITLILSFFLSVTTKAQTFGITSSAVWLSNCNQDAYYNTSGSGSNLIGSPGNVFTNFDLGAYTHNSGSLVFRGGEVRSFKTPGVSNVCSARMYYRVYLQSSVPGSFTVMNLAFVDDCVMPAGTFPSGGSCVAGDQKWNRVIADGVTTPYAPVDLTSLAAGNYVLEVYYEVTGSSASTSLCDETVILNNAGANYKAFFSIQSPSLSSFNPTTCNGTEGSITISGLVAGVNYTINYSDDGVPVGPLNLVANGSGQVNITGLNAGTYSEFVVEASGCTTELNTGIILSNPVFTPKFTKVNPICAGTTAPGLPSTSNNGISGTWSPSAIDNQNSGSYTFTPTPGQCGMPVTINVTVNPNVTPTFTFGTSLTICAGASVPALPTTSGNGITGTWSPATVDNQNSATYTFTPTAGQCANPATFAVTVNPNITPLFSFGTTLTICAGETVPSLPATSDNGITGTWSPATVDNQNSGSYTFTPSAELCATSTTYTVTVNPNVTPVFSFGTTLTICAGGAVPALPATSDNGITGTWSATSVDNQNSATYTFTPTAGQCATTTNFNVTVTPNITPTFTFGTSLTICDGGTVPALPTTSGNGITGTWSPSAVDDQNSATYTFTPDGGQCATAATFAVTVNPILTPSFPFGTSLSICAGGTVPALPTTSDNGIAGTWSAATVDNQNSAAYIFTPSAGQCATTATFTVTVNSNTIPTFSFGTTLSICAGGTVPVLPTTSDNGITGTWNAATVDNQNSATYTFTPAAGQCATTATFSVTVNSNITPAFSFGTALAICAGGTVPTLPGTSDNGITGTWSTATVDNQNSATYTFTPAAGQCATVTTFDVTVNANVTPLFSFGTSLTICAGSGAPTLPATSDNGITGTWNPTVVNDQTSGTYTFTPTAGQCATTTSFTVTVTPNTLPTFSFGTALTICAGGAVPVLPATSANGINGTWNPATVDNQTSGVYTFTPVTQPGECISIVRFTVTVNPVLTPTFSFGTSQTICNGASVPALPATSDNGIAGVWNPAVVSNQVSGVYTFTTNAGQCATGGTSFTVTVPAVATVNAASDTTVTDGATIPTFSPSGTPGGVNFTWTNSNPAIGLAASGSGTVPSFTAINKGNTPVSATITVTPMVDGCAGTSTTYVITVNPLDKELFVPNVFTPNGDGKNDQLFVYGNYIERLDMRIFNQWGEHIYTINSRTQGWDGTYKGKAQPVGVYVYALEAVLTGGKTVKLKGSITLIR